MRLLELELENWGRHEKLKIDLSGGLQIGGRNGTGKSSILEAIRFVFSESAAGYKSRIRHGSDFARVKVRFSRDADVYSIEKKLFPKKASTAVMWINRNPVADNPGSVYARLNEVLPEEVMDRLVYVPQGTLTDIISRLRMKGGRQELDGLFGLDRLENVYKGIGEELRIKEAEQEMLGMQLAKFPPDAWGIFDKELEAVLSERKSLEKQLEEHRMNQKIVSSKVEQLQKKVEEMQSVKKRSDGITARLNELRVGSAVLGKEIESLKENLRLLEERKEEARNLVGVSEGLKKYPAIRDLLVLLSEGEKKLSLLGDLSEKRKVFADVEKELNCKYGLEIEHESNKEKASKLRSDKEVRRQQLMEEKCYLKELSSLRGKARCPRCNQKLTEEHIAEEKRTAEEKIRTFDREIKEMSGELLSVQGKEESTTKQLDALVRKEIENRRRKQDIEAGAAEKEVILTDMKKIKESLSVSGYAGESVKEVEERNAELADIRAHVSVFGREAGQEGNYVKEIKAKERLLSEVASEEMRLSAESGKLKYDEPLLEDLRKRREGFMSQKGVLSLDTERCESRIREGQAKEADVVSKKKEFSGLNAKEKELLAGIGLVREARELFHTDKGVVKFLREKYIKQLGILLTQHFRRLNQNPKYLDVVFDRDYDIEVRTKDGGFSVDNLSGGEKVQISIALRIALLELLSPTRLLILDEPFGSLDGDHREALGEALNKIAGEGQLIIVTHIPVDSLQLPEMDLGGY